MCKWLLKFMIYAVTTTAKLDEDRQCLWPRGRGETSWSCSLISQLTDAARQDVVLGRGCLLHRTGRAYSMETVQTGNVWVLPLYKYKAEDVFWKHFLLFERNRYYKAYMKSINSDHINQRKHTLSSSNLPSGHKNKCMARYRLNSLQSLLVLRENQDTSLNR